VGLLLTLISAGLAFVAAACGGDRRESFYPSLADADKDGAITRGWIPEFLPQSSRAIHEVHDISPSREWCTFEFAPSDTQNLRKDLKSVETLPPRVAHVPKPGVSWWPVVLQGDLDVARIHRAGFELYAFEKPVTSVDMEISLVAIDWSKGMGLFYSTPE